MKNRLMQFLPCPQSGVCIQTWIAAILTAYIPADQLDRCYSVGSALVDVPGKFTVWNGKVLLRTVDLQLQP